MNRISIASADLMNLGGFIKRSEMVDRLESLVYDSWSWRSGDRHLANKILELVEKEGMLPPPTEIQEDYDGYIFRTLKWDPEDENS